MGEYMDPEERRLYEKGKRDGLEAAAASVWDGLPEIQRKAIRKHDQKEMATRKCIAAAIRALKEQGEQ